jgi:hypothetical protein
MRTRVWPVLSGALLLSACGSKVVGEDLPPCQPPQLADFELPQALAGLEVRRSNATAALPSSSWSVRVLGESCADTSCAAAVAELDAQQVGWHVHGVQTGDSLQYLIGMNEGNLVGSATSDPELVALIGPIDTVAEAQLVAELKGLGCMRAGEHDGSLQVVGKDTISDCSPITTQDVLYRIDPDASVHELERGDEEQSNGCIGRRPAGLVGRSRVTPSSPIGDFLARSAELEAASVVAFRILESELRAHGAPQTLLDRTREAAADEIMHARLVQRLAERFGGQVTERAVRVARVRDLETIALENSVEGCVSETWGCLLGMHQAEHAKSPLLRRAYQRIAADEARHAQLSWDIAEWAEQKLDGEARERIAKRRGRAVHELAGAVSHESQPETVREFLGLPDAATSRRLFAHVQAALWS